ncbi:transporter substrate-binding domain-containing protein [Chitinibacter bivalviorum]|uniref:Transporter substrate-binding domain-containing protein n=1 Tax=Chitinibacter bivalviorum TaxID=2739434 RepID=A0A7H9BKR0_9NEIS|nr:transporter substrate-binding domain-containing protein [Chitinibacter bivalviorum]QLG89079.1 transporter substrate-binding domain-containing protein [Chitinibacter bivalviorum]
MRPLNFSGCAQALLACWAGLFIICSVWAEEPMLRVRFAPEKDYGPFIYQDPQGQLQGLSIDILHELAPMAHIELETQAAAPLATILTRAQAGQVDLISSLRPTPERAIYLGFTQPYVAIPAVLVSRQSDPQRTLEQLAELPVAVGKGYAVEQFVRDRHPRVQWLAVSDDAVALKLLEQGQVKAIVADLASVIFITRAQRNLDWRVDQNVGFQYQLSFAFAKDKPEIGERLDRALRSLPLVRREAILSHWLDAQKIEASRPHYLILIGIAVGLLLLSALIVIVGRHRQRGQHDRR